MARAISDSHRLRLSPELQKKLNDDRDRAGLRLTGRRTLSPIAASHHLARFKDAARLALEMGNSPAMIFRHYPPEPVKPIDADGYWNIAPAATDRKVIQFAAKRPVAKPVD